MNPAQYIILNKGLGMSTGKAAAQAAHAARESVMITPNNNTFNQWFKGGHNAVVVLEAPSSEQLLIIQRYIEQRGFKTALIIDEGRTEIDRFSPTALGVEILDRDNSHVRATFGEFRTYREDKRPPQPGPTRPKPDPTPPRKYDGILSWWEERLYPLRSKT